MSHRHHLIMTSLYYIKIDNNVSHKCDIIIFCSSVTDWKKLAHSVLVTSAVNKIKLHKKKKKTLHIEICGNRYLVDSKSEIVTRIKQNSRHLIQLMFHICGH